MNPKKKKKLIAHSCIKSQGMVLNSLIVLLVTINNLTVMPENPVLSKVTGNYNLNEFTVHLPCFMNHI